MIFRWQLPLLILTVCSLLAVPLALTTESLWQDQNPYGRQRIKQGAILKLRFQEQLQVVANHTRSRNSESSYSLLPDRSTLAFLPQSEGSDNSEKRVRNRQRSNLSVNTLIAVRATAIDADGIVRFSGVKRVQGENGAFSLNVSGVVDQKDIDFESGQVIDSVDVADLRAVLRTEYAKANRALQSVPATPVPATAADAPTTDAAAADAATADAATPVNQAAPTNQNQSQSQSVLTPEQQQTLLIEQLQRILGELRDQQ